MLKSLKITDNFYLNGKTINQIQSELSLIKPKSLPVNFIFTVDVSGSMSYELREIRKQLKNKLSSLVKEGDTISIIWFSGLNDAGILKEEVEIKSLKNLEDLNTAIDRYLTPQGATSFSRPLVLAKEVIDRIKQNRPNSIFSLIFLTDGYHNSGSFEAVTKSLTNLSPDLASSTFIEYGVYADSARLTQMSEILGGEKILAKNFDEYDVVFEDKISKTLSSNKKVVVDITDSKHNFCFSVEDGEVIAYLINDNQILISDTIDTIYYFSENGVNIIAPDNTSIPVIYAAMNLLSDRMLNKDVELMFGLLGDVNAFEMFNNAFGKQKLNDFKTFLKECVTDESKRFISGKVDKLVLDENAYSFLNLIDILTKDDDTLFYPNHTNFNYNKIGGAKVQKSTLITEENKLRIANATTIEELNEIVTDMNTNHVGELKFVDSNKTKGYKLSDLVWNEKRANLSIRVRYNGTVDLPKNNFGITTIETFIYRTYTIVKDGILNLTTLPISFSSKEVYNELQKNNLIYETDPFIENDHIYTIDFNKLPIINRSMVKNISAKLLSEMEWKLLKLQANKKVYDYYEKTLFPKESIGFIDKYGKDAEEWLKTIGITESLGFAPKLTAAESSDFYMAVVLDTKIAGYSSLPKVNDVEAKIKENKALKPNEALLAEGVNDYLKILELMESVPESVKDQALSDWLNKSKTKFVKEKREVMMEIAKIKFSLILSKGWFEEFATFEENTLSLKIDDIDLKFTFDMKEEEVKI